MHLKVRDQKLKTIKYIYRLLYENLLVTTNQILIIDIHIKKKKRNTTEKDIYDIDYMWNLKIWYKWTFL